MDGQLTLNGADIRAKDLLIKQFTTGATIAHSVVYLNDLRATMNEKDYVGANGKIALAKPFSYTGSLTADVKDLSTFEPLLRALGHPTPLAGSLNITWQGSGDAATIKNTGELKVKLEKGRFANLLGLQANIETSYTPEGLSAPTIYLRSEKMDFQATMEAKGSRLEIDKVQINQGTAKYATGYISLPFNWENLGTGKPLFPSDGKVVLNIQSENLDLKKLFGDLGMTPPVLGEVSVKVDAQGTLDQLTAALDLRMTALRSENLRSCNRRHSISARASRTISWSSPANCNRPASSRFRSTPAFRSTSRRLSRRGKLMKTLQLLDRSEWRGVR